MDQGPIEIIAGYGAPTDSFNAAIRFFNNKGMMTERQYASGIKELLGADDVPSFKNEKEARIVFLYVVQETLRVYIEDNIVPDMAAVWEEVIDRSSVFLAKNPWSIKTYGTVNGETKVDAVGLPKKKKGKKKEMAIDIYCRMNDGTTERGTIIQAFMDEIGMTKAGATTYFHNMKKEYGFRGPKTQRGRKPNSTTTTTATPTEPGKRGRKPEGKMSKAKIAEQVYLRMKGQPKKEILAVIVEESGTTPAGANTYYCMWKKEYGV